MAREIRQNLAAFPGVARDCDAIAIGANWFAGANTGGRSK
jgi:hypothetical protein